MGESFLYMSIVTALMARPFSRLKGRALKSTTSNFVRMNGMNSPTPAVTVEVSCSAF